MGWLHRNKQGTTALDDPFTTSAEIEGVFDVEREDLGWIAYAISGNKQHAEESLVDAKKTAAYWDWFLRDWLVHWAESATARVAATNTGESLREAAKKCRLELRSPRSRYSREKSSQLAQLGAEEIVDALDPVARTILVLRGMRRAAISDRAILLNASRRAALGAYCHALWWLRAHSGGSISQVDDRATGFARC